MEPVSPVDTYGGGLGGMDPSYSIEPAMSGDSNFSDGGGGEYSQLISSDAIVFLNWHRCLLAGFASHFHPGCQDLRLPSSVPVCSFGVRQIRCRQF